MNVGSKTLAPGMFNRHLVALAHQKAKRKRFIAIGLSLTSMVDMFSMLVIFLLQSFAASPELLIVTKGVTLPSAHTGKELKDAPVLSLSTSDVYLDQKRVGSTQALLKNPDPLLERLEGLRNVWQKSHPHEKFPGEINLQAHKELSASIVSRFMGFLPSQNYGSIQLAVTSGGSGS